MTEKGSDRNKEEEEERRGKERSGGGVRTEKCKPQSFIGITSVY